MKNQPGTTRSTRQPRQLDQNSSFKSKLRLSKGKLGEIFKKPQYERQLIALENTIEKLPLKRLVTENLIKDQQQNSKGLILTSTPYHLLRSNPQSFFSDRRPSSSISPIKQQTPHNDIGNNEANANGKPETSEDSEVDLSAKKPREEQSIIKCISSDIKDNTQNTSKSRQNNSYRTRSRSNKSHVDHTPLSTPAAEGQPVLSGEQQAAHDSIICADSPLKDNDLSKETKEKTPNNLRRSRKDQHNNTTIDKLCRTKSDPSPFSAATKKSKIPLRTISQDREINSNKENEKNDANVTFIQPVRITPSRSGQTQNANYKAVTPKNTHMVVDPDSNCLKENNVLVEVAGSPVRNRDEFVNKTPRSNRQIHHTKVVEENSEIATKRKRYDTVSLAVQTKNIEHSRLLSSEATQTSRVPTQSDSSNVKILKNEVLSSPFKLFRKANLDSQKTTNKEVQTTFASIDSGERSKPCLFRNNTRTDQAERKREFESFVKGLEEYAAVVDKVSDTNSPVADRARKKKPRNNPPSGAKKARGILDKIVSKLTKTAENTRPSHTFKTPTSDPKASTKKPTIFRRSNRIASEKKLGHPAVIHLGDDSRESSVSRSDSGRPNIFDSLEDGNVIDVVDFSNEGVPELSAIEKPWRFEGSSGPMPCHNNLTLKFVRSEADISYSDNLNVSEQSSAGQISLGSESGLDTNQHEESKAFVKNNVMPNLLSRKSQALPKAYSRNKSLAPNQNHDLCESIEETLGPVLTNNVNEFKKPANPKPVTKKMTTRTKSKKCDPPVNSSKQSNTVTEEVEPSSQRLSDVETESSKIMYPIQIGDKTRSRSQARKNLFGIQSAEPAPSENLSDESQTIADSFHSKKQLGSGNTEQSNIEESRTSVDGSRRKRRLRSRKSVPKEDLDQPVNRNKKVKADVSSQSNILDTVSEPEANNNNTEFPEALPVTQLKEGNPKANRQLEVRVETMPTNSLVNNTPLITPLTPKKPKNQKKKLPLRNNVTNEHGTTFLDHLVDASNIIQDIGGKRPQRERKQVKLSKILDRPGLVLLPVSIRVTSSKPRKPRTKSSTTINNNGTTSNNASNQTALSLAAGSSQSSVNPKSIITPDLSGLEILPHGKKSSGLNNLDTIVDKDDSQDVQPIESKPAAKSKRAGRKKATTADTNLKKPAEVKPKLDQPVIVIENLRLNPVDEQPMVCQSDILPVVDDIANIPDVSGIHCLQLDTVPNLGNIAEENANDAFSLQDNHLFTQPKPPTSRRPGRAKKGSSSTKGKVGRPKKKGAATIKENLEQSEEVSRVNEDIDIKMGLELRVPEIGLAQANQLSSHDENSVRPDLNNEPILNKNGDHADDRRSTFSDDLAYSLNPSPSFGSGSNMNGFADESDYIRTTVDGKPLKFKFASSLPTEAKFKKLQNVYVTSCSKDPTTGLFSFGYLKLNGNDQKPLTVASYAFTFVVIEGTAHVEVEGSSRTVNEGDCFMVPKGMKYSIKNGNEHNNLFMSYTRIKFGNKINII